MRLIKDELDGNIMTESVGITPKNYSSLMNNAGGDKK